MKKNLRLIIKEITEREEVKELFSKRTTKNVFELVEVREKEAFNYYIDEDKEEYHLMSNNKVAKLKFQDANFIDIFRYKNEQKLKFKNSIIFEGYIISKSVLNYKYLLMILDILENYGIEKEDILDLEEQLIKNSFNQKIPINFLKSSLMMIFLRKK